MTKEELIEIVDHIAFSSMVAAMSTGEIEALAAFAVKARADGFEYGNSEPPNVVRDALGAWARQRYFAMIRPQIVAKEREEA